VRQPDLKENDVVVLVSDGRIGVVKGFGKVAFGSPYGPVVFVAIGHHKTFIANDRRSLRKIGLLEKLAYAAAGKLPRNNFKYWKMPDGFRDR
jgi:hypothetical protein